MNFFDINKKKIITLFIILFFITSIPVSAATISNQSFLASVWNSVYCTVNNIFNLNSESCEVRDAEESQSDNSNNNQQNTVVQNNSATDNRVARNNAQDEQTETQKQQEPQEKIIERIVEKSSFTLEQVQTMIDQSIAGLEVSPQIIVKSSGSSSGSSGGVSSEHLSRQIDVILDNIGDNIDNSVSGGNSDFSGQSLNVTNATTTNLYAGDFTVGTSFNAPASTISDLTVSGDAFFGGNLGIGTSTPDNPVVISRDRTQGENGIIRVVGNIGATGAYFYNDVALSIENLGTNGQQGNVALGLKTPYTSGQLGIFNGNASTTATRLYFWDNKSSSFPFIIGKESTSFNTEDFIISGTLDVSTTTGTSTISGLLDVGSGKILSNGNQILYRPDENSIPQTLILGDGGQNLTSGYNTFVGIGAGYNSVSGNANTFVGRDAGYNNTSAHSNVFVGLRSGYSNTVGSGNVFLGRFAGFSQESGYSNVFIGRQSGYNSTTGVNNVFIGHDSGSSNTTGSNNIIIGTDVDVASSTGGNQLNIGNTIYGDLSNKYIGIGTSTPAAKINLYGTELDDKFLTIESTRGIADTYTLFEAKNLGNTPLIVRGDNRVGINTNDPETTFHVNGGDVYLDIMDGFQDEGIIRIGRKDGGSRASYIKTYNDSVAGNNYMSFSVHDGTVGSETEVMTLLGNGNLGIGTNAPNSKLDVAGSGSFTGNLVVDSGSGTNTITLRDTVISKTTGSNLSVNSGIQASGRLTGSNLGQSVIIGYGSSEASVQTDGVKDLIFKNTSEQMRITSGGNVGIGTTTPSTKLDVWGNLNVGTSSTPTLFANTATGRVGIGTTNPSGKLDVATAVGSNLLNFTNTGNGLSYNFAKMTTPIGGGPDLTLGSGFNRLILAPTYALRMPANVEFPSGINWSLPNQAVSIVGATSFTLQTNVANTNLFTGGYNANTVIRPYSSSYNLLLAPDGGNVGIGTTTPIHKLHVGGIANNGIGFHISNVSGSETLSIANDIGGLSGYSGTLLRGGPYNNFVFQTMSNDNDAEGFRFINDSNTHLMSILRGGNVGIGTTSPSAKLAVTGSGTGTGKAFAIANSSDTEKFSIQDDGSLNITATTTINTPTGHAARIKLITGANTSAYEISNDNYFNIKSLNNGKIMFSGNTGSSIVKTAIGGVVPTTNATLEVRGNNVNTNPTLLVNNSAGTTNMSVLDNGTTYFRGNVGIGTTSPSAKLDVWGNLNVGTSSTPTLFANTATGRVGIGTSSPSSALHVVGNITSPGTGTNSEKFGLNSVASADGSLAIGYDSSATDAGSGQNVAIGAYSSVTAFGSVAVGYLSSGATGGVAVGYDADATGDNSIAIGRGTDSTYRSSIGIGYGASPTAANQLRIGGTATGYQIDDVYIGNGVTNVSPSGLTLNSTGGSGTNISGADITIAGGKGTGNASGGDIIFSTSDSESSGTTLQSLSEKMRINSNGYVGIGIDSPDEKLTINGTIKLYRTDGSSPATIMSHPTHNNALSIPSRLFVGDLTATNAALQVIKPFNDRGRITLGLSPFITIDSPSNLASTLLSIVSNNDSSKPLTIKAYSATQSANLQEWQDSSGLALTVVSPLGNIGIGTSTPESKLHIHSTSTSDIAHTVLRISSNSTGVDNGPALEFNFAEGLAGKIAVGNVSGGGSNANMSFYTAQNSIYNERMTITNSGNLGIGTTTPSQKLVVDGNGQFTSVTSGAYSADLNLTVDGILTTSASDIRLKEDVEQLDQKEILNKILQLKPSKFTWKETGSSDLGLIAQEVEEILPEIVFTNKTDGYKGINYSRLPALLISAIQELSGQVASVFEGTADLVVSTIKSTFVETEKIQTDEICVGETCLTESELIELLDKNNVESRESENTDTSEGADTSTDEVDTETEESEENTTTVDDVTDPDSTQTTEEIAEGNTEESIEEEGNTEPVVEEVAEEPITEEVVEESIVEEDIVDEPADSEPEPEIDSETAPEPEPEPAPEPETTTEEPAS